MYVNRESQNSKAIPRNMRSVFNMTMTHRLNADIPHPYAVIMARPSANPLPKTVDYVSGKKKLLVAWVVRWWAIVTLTARGSVMWKNYKNIFQSMFSGVAGRWNATKDGPTTPLVLIHWTPLTSLIYHSKTVSVMVMLLKKIYKILRIGGIIPIVSGGANYTKLLPPNHI